MAMSADVENRPHLPSSYLLSENLHLIGFESSVGKHANLPMFSMLG